MDATHKRQNLLLGWRSCPHQIRLLKEACESMKSLALAIGADFSAETDSLFEASFGDEIEPVRIRSRSAWGGLIALNLEGG